MKKTAGLMLVLCGCLMLFLSWKKEPIEEPESEILAAEPGSIVNIERIMSYSLVGNENIMWENDELLGKVESLEIGEWLNYGGYKLWPAPQSVWNWPPDKFLDRGPCEVKIAGEDTLIMTGMKSEQSGIRFIREIKIFKKSSKIEIKQIMENTSDKEVEWGIWEVTQLQPKARIVVPFSKGNKHWDKDNAAEHDDWDIRDEEGIAYLMHETAKGKVFFMTDKNWVAWELGGIVYIKQFVPIIDKPYPDGEANVEIFTSDEYPEVEVISPLIKLKPGEKYSYNETWYLYESKTGFKKNEDLRVFIENKL